MSAKKATAHSLIQGELKIAKRERSGVWQCRLCVDGVWQRVTTGERDLSLAKKKAKELYIEAHVRKKNNIVPITRYFKDVARVVVRKLEDDLQSSRAKVVFRDCVTVLRPSAGSAGSFFRPIIGASYSV